MKRWSLLKRIIWLFRLGIIGVSSVLKTVIGNPIHITDALAKPAQALSVKLEPIQDLHGYDNPWPGGGEKNLLDPDAKTTTSTNICFYKYTGFLLKANQAYTLSTYSSANATGIYFRSYPDNTNVAFKYNAKSVTFTPTEDMMVWLDAYYSPAPTEGIANINLQLELGSTSTEWTPYSNICPISGRTSATVTRTGVNVWDEEWEQGGYDENSGVGISAGNISTQRSKNGISVKPSTAYYFKCDTTIATNPSVMVCEYDASGNYLGCFYKYAWEFAFTTKATTALMKFRVYNTNISTIGGAGNLSINYPSTDHDYHAYTRTTYPIPLGQTVYGGTLDVLTGVLTVDRAEVATPLVIPALIGTYSDRKDYGWNFPQKAYGLSNVWSQAFKTESVNGVPPIYCVAGRGANTYVTFGVPLAEADDAQSAGDYIRSLSPSIVIELATPITIQLTPQQVELLLGENNVWSDGTMTLVYLADGNASDVEALNILLGGRYVNNHGEDEPTDREALDILLGGTR